MYTGCTTVIILQFLSLLDGNRNMFLHKEEAFKEVARKQTENEEPCS
jgi:hypothetical protein